MRVVEKDSGFTLIELLIVIILIAVLAAIAIPMYLSQCTKAKDASAKKGVHTVLVGVQSYSATNDDTLLEATADGLKAQVEMDLLPWPDNPYANPLEPMTHSPVQADVAVGDLVDRHAAGAQAFTLGVKVGDSNVFWVHR